MQKGIGRDEMDPDILGPLHACGFAVQAPAQPSHQVPVDEAAQGSLELDQPVCGDDLVHFALKSDQSFVAEFQGCDGDQHGAQVVAGGTGTEGSSWTDPAPMGRQAHEAPGGQVDLGRQPIYQELHFFPHAAPMPTHVTEPFPS
ncbi:hypothetical protein [Streptomyces niveus]|uniref:hypothetical protein n=1 Tax=Streptomyces niveus TaxID=193462 RepID=UPI00342F2010